ncbi:MAG: ABC transporter permease subunit [Ruminiclostridium sp.]|nr:ABC transporter permease subunit [Ruminiclostridium sp.]
MNIYLRELKANAKGLLLWLLWLIVLIAAGMGKFAGAENSSQSVNAIMEAMPDVILAMFGMNGLDLDTIEGYYGVISFLVLIMAAIHSGMLGSVIIAKEERDKTSEFLFVRPVTRTSVITSKIFAALTNVVLFNLLSFLTSWIIAKTVAKGSSLSSIMLNISVGMLLIQLLFLFMGTCLASGLKESGKASGITTGVVLVSYITYIISDMDERFRFLKVLTPFKYFEPASIINGAGLETIYVAILLILTALFIIATYIFFQKRDLNS